MSSAALLNAFHIDKTGRGIALSWDDIANGVPPTPDDTYLWVHLNWMGAGVAQWLTDKIGLDPTIVENLATRGTRPSVSFYDQGYLLNLRGVNLNAESDPEDMISVRIWVSDTLVITLRNQSIRAFADIRAAITDGHAPHNADEFVLTLAERLIFRLDDVVRQIEETVDGLEDVLDESPDAKTLKLRMTSGDIRRRLSRLRRHMAPQRDALGTYVDQKPAWPDKRDKRRARTLTDRVTRLVEELDSLRDRTQIVNDSLMAVETERMNRTMYWLTVIAGLFLPISFLTGLLGINVGGIPAAENPLGFPVVAAIMAVVVIAEVWLFKKLRLI
ncbi:CorA family divalent cation transporter [Thalassospira sp.]|uniref:CorA family divalent cation transporter n=1 Tax=Thalassospira sp. TaxID=1912094 RepID=UPI0027346367|nr:CorA family divalent cation transporter [Thalassospira sp.]MDP2699477.1 CorA family divalent cation transporter [Thalassospira sp.]